MNLLDVFIIAAVTTIGGLVVSSIQSYIKSRTKDTLAHTLPLIMEGISVNTDAIKTLLEVSHGTCNGNVDASLDKINKFQDKQTAFFIGRV
jgi:hypothetical protein